MPALALDMYEHSYHMDYGAKAAAYVGAFMNNLNWENASRIFAEEISVIRYANLTFPRRYIKVQA